MRANPQRHLSHYLHSHTNIWIPTMVHLATARWISGGFPDSPKNALLSIASLDPIQVTLERLSY
ncbi:hypothetical protein AX15_007548 [Amanita polypyramis BW_CC]|nr:hypothetical protein AX15_007548 [Amanita polypyramis BW_CC]